MTVFINGRSVVHKDSGGVLNTISVNLTPPESQAIPYANIAYSRDAVHGASSVFVENNPLCHKDSYFSKSSGDQAGSLGGIYSGTVCARADFLTASTNVYVENKPAVRNGDLMVSNQRNTAAAALYQPGQGASVAKSVDHIEAQLESPQTSSTCTWAIHCVEILTKSMIESR